jgi:hypothetical protein
MKVSPLARLYYEDQVRTFVRCLRHEAAHALRKELNGPNAAARVAAARTLLGDDMASPAPQTPPAQPGVVIVIEQAKPLPLTPMIEIPARPVEADEP